MRQSRFSSELIVGIIVALFFGIALYLRVAFPYEHVFVGDWIKFTSVDAYRHMYTIDNLVHNFPHLSSFNPYAVYPGGVIEVGRFLFFDRLLAGIIWLIGLGSPTQHTVDVVSVYFPAVLGALTVIPVYFTGRALFNRWAGVLSAGLVAILPGEFLGRSLLGFTDYHVAETLFAAIIMLFLVLAVKSAAQKELTFNHLKRRDGTVITKPIVYSLLAGIFLGIYLLTWVGALLFVFIIFVFMVVQFIIDHLRNRSTDYLCPVGFITFLIALITLVPVFDERIYLASLIIALLTPVVLSAVSRLMKGWKLRPAYYPLILIGIGLAGVAVFYVVSPSLLGSMLAKFSVLTRAGHWRTILEAQPILFPDGEFSLAVVWGNFTTGFFLSLISLGILIHFIIKQGEAGRALLVVWSLIILAATLLMRRFAYYFAVNVALLTGYFSWLILQFAGFRERADEAVQVVSRETKKKAKQKKKRGAGSRATASRANMVMGAIIVFFLVFYPLIGPLPSGAKPAIDVASQPQFAPSDAWCESLPWLKDNTPEPFGDPDSYYELHEVPFHYPETAYGVTAWWDYGYWITRIAHRMPSSNPGQAGARRVAKLFIAQDEASINKGAKRLGSKYIIVDYDTATGKFYAMASWAGSSDEEFYDVYYQLQNNQLVSVLLLYPEYYRSLAVRLYNFDGREVASQDPMVISYQEKTNSEGERYKEITGTESFTSYEEAEEYVATRKSGNYRLVGADPFVSPVPLMALGRYILVYSSESSVTQPGVGMIPEVKIFEDIRTLRPRVETLKTRNITDTSVRLSGKLTKLGTARDVVVSFLWGTTKACKDGETPAVTMNSTGRFSRKLSGLSTDTTYYYKAKVVGDDIGYGKVESFRVADLKTSFPRLHDGATITIRHNQDKYYLPITGNWDGDGGDKIGLCCLSDKSKGNVFYLRADDGTTTTIRYKQEKYRLPLTGDWDGDGDDEVGLYCLTDSKRNVFYLRADDDTTTTIKYKQGGYLPVAGDWDGDGDDEIGLCCLSDDSKRNVFYLRADDGTTTTIRYKQGDDYLPVAGDWDGDGDDEIGLCCLSDDSKRNVFYLRADDGTTTIIKYKKLVD